MNIYNQTENYDNSVFRYVVVALLAELKNRIYIYQHLSDGTTEKVDIPFIYSITGSERFLKDEFQYDSINNGKAIGDYEKVPRGIINIESIGINSSNQVNKFTQAKFVHEVDGELKTFYLRCCFLPIVMNFSCDMICSSQIEMLKITEAVMSKMYAVNTFYVDLGMMHVQSSYTIPTDFSQDRTIDFALDTQKEYKVSFSIEVNSFYPVFEHGILLDEIQEMVKGKKGSVMQLRSDEWGRVGIYAGGLLTKFYVGTGEEKDIDELDKKVEASEVDSDYILETLPPPTYILSNTDKDKDYTVKLPGYKEKQNINRKK